MNESKPSLSSEDNLPKLPTTPYDDEQFQKGYTAGYGAGYENGYSEGQTAGSDLKLAPWIDKTIGFFCPTCNQREMIRAKFDEEAG